MTATNPTIQNISRWPRKHSWRVLTCIVLNGDIVVSDSDRVTAVNLLANYTASKPDKTVYYHTKFSLQVILGLDPMIVVNKDTLEPDDAYERLLSEAPEEFPRVLKLLTHYRFMVEDKQAQEIL